MTVAKVDDTENDDEEEYIPVARRRQERVERVRAQLVADKRAVLKKLGCLDPSFEETTPSGTGSGRSTTVPGKNEPDANSEVAKARTSRTLLEEAQRLAATAQNEEAESDAAKLERVKAEEKRLLETLLRSSTAPLMSVKERAQGIVYTEPLKTDYELPSKIRRLSPDEADALRKKFSIDVSGRDVPPPVLNFEDMRFPKCISIALREMGVEYPTQIQMQGIPAALQGRDLIGIAFTGSGKTMVFALPMVLLGLQAELKAPFLKGEGPFGLVICPSRELANQTHGTIMKYIDALTKGGFPKLRALCVIGGTSVLDQTRALIHGVHFVAATPGRLNDLLNKRRLSVAQCVYLVFDEADRLVDLGFEEDVRATLDFFSHQRQTLLFSATMPRKIQEFARSALVDPIIVNVGRAGAANLDVLQEVEYVKQQDKLPYLVQCLQKTAPPVVVFCENKRSVDEVFEYLLLKGVEAAAIHGGLSQQERLDALSGFRDGTKDVLIGTDVASKGLDFPTIQHVINFDMPKEIENYVHRIGRTGRRGKTGVATTFINRNQDETVLLDLKALLVEAKQKLPPFLESLGTGSLYAEEIGGVRGCAYCGGLGHRIAQCPKLDSQATKNLGKREQLITGSSRYGDGTGYSGDW